MTRRHTAAFGALALIWGSSFLLMSRVIPVVGSLGVVTIRSLIGGTLLVVAARLTGRPLRADGHLADLAFVGATAVAGQLVGFAFALPRIGTAMTAIFAATIPFFSMIVGHLWGLTPTTRRETVGLLLGLVGVVLIVGFPAVPVTGTFLVGCLSGLAGALAAAIGSQYANHRLGAVEPWTQTTAAFLLGGGLTLPLLVLAPMPGVPGARDIGLLLLLGTFSSAVAYVLYFTLLAEVGATRTNSVEFMVTAVAAVLGVVVLGERLSTVQWLGGAIVLAGCTLVLGLGAPSPSAVPHEAPAVSRGD